MKISTTSGVMSVPTSIPVVIAGFEKLGFALTPFLAPNGTLSRTKWVVTHIATGVKIGPGLSKYDAVCYAAEELNYWGSKEVRRAIRSAYSRMPKP